MRILYVYSFTSRVYCLVSRKKRFCVSFLWWYFGIGLAHPTRTYDGILVKLWISNDFYGYFRTMHPNLYMHISYFLSTSLPPPAVYAFVYALNKLFYFWLFTLYSNNRNGWCISTNGKRVLFLIVTPRLIVVLVLQCWNKQCDCICTHISAAQCHIYSIYAYAFEKERKRERT